MNRSARPGNRYLRFATQAVRALALAGAAALGVHAANAHAQLAYDGYLTVAPNIAVVDTARRIAIRGNWPNACPPASAEIVADADPAPKRLTIRLNEVFTFAACAQVVTPFLYEVNYTPRLPGTLPVVAVTSSGPKVADGLLLTVSKENAAAAVDLTGVWFDTPSAGSVLLIKHGQSIPDAAVGNWSVFDNSGQSRSLMFHSSVRTANPNIYQAPLYSLTAPTGSACPTYGCPVAGFTSTQVGWVRIEVRSAREITVEAWMHGLPNDVLAFRSNLVRYEF